MPHASIVVPAYNSAATLAATLTSLLAQTYESYEIIVVDDGSTDQTQELLEGFVANPRIRVVRQKNRGLAGARNSGIAAARGEIIGFCDADDLWEPAKLAGHAAHLKKNPKVGLSYAGSALIDDFGQPLGQAQRPTLKNISTAHIFKRNPIGNGSSLVARREVFDQIAYRPEHETSRDWYFDETFRQSEDIECWLRIALTTSWTFEGIPGLLTKYRINSNGLSAATEPQMQAWEQMVRKLTPLDQGFFREHLPAARAYQLRYLCRRAIKSLDADRAGRFAKQWINTSKRPFIEEPLKSIATWAGMLLLVKLGPQTLERAISIATFKFRQGAL
ncbi:glycosyltransferase family 2 protein [Rhodobacteraceae bacterium D3-12]|nr:glycosyltransferase family 2 protein [Rhodobacteraceae bacterium D3-12]